MRCRLVVLIGLDLDDPDQDPLGGQVQPAAEQVGGDQVGGAGQDGSVQDGQDIRSRFAATNARRSSIPRVFSTSAGVAHPRWAVQTP